MKAHEVMTHALATCAPDANVTQVAAIMRDRDIGNVLVVDDGKLRGIATDRDLALQALAGEDDPRQTPISKFMSTKIVTGEASWSLERVAKTMARHQVRRLPIVQDGKLVGIVSLSDLARHEDRKDVVTKSLQAVSTPPGIAAPSRSSGHAGAWIGMVLAALTAAMAAWLTWNRTGQVAAKQIMRRNVYHTAQHATSAARDKIGEAATSKPVRELRHQVSSELKVLSAQLPTIQSRHPKHKRFLFV